MKNPVKTLIPRLINISPTLSEKGTEACCVSVPAVSKIDRFLMKNVGSSSWFTMIGLFPINHFNVDSDVTAAYHGYQAIISRRLSINVVVNFWSRLIFYFNYTCICGSFSSS